MVPTLYTLQQVKGTGRRLARAQTNHILLSGWAVGESAARGEDVGQEECSKPDRIPHGPHFRHLQWWRATGNPLRLRLVIELHAYVCVVSKLHATSSLPHVDPRGKHINLHTLYPARRISTKGLAILQSAIGRGGEMTDACCAWWRT